MKKNLYQEKENGAGEGGVDTFSASKEIQTATITQKESISTVVKNIEQIVVVSEEAAAAPSR